MKKPSPFALPPRCGFSLLLLLLLSCAIQPVFASAADSTAPVISLVDTRQQGLVTIRVDGRSKISVKISLKWQLLLNGQPGQKGFTPSTLLPGKPTLLHLPLKWPAGNEEAWLKITCETASQPATKTAGTQAVTLLPLRPWRGDPAIPAAGELTFIDSNNSFTIRAAHSQIQFDKQTGYLLHYEAGGVRLMIDSAGPLPTLWPGIQPRLQLFSTSTGTQLVIVKAEYTLPETASLLHLSYTINAAGVMLVGQSLESDTSVQLPDTARVPLLPHFGMQWSLPAGFDTLTWFGSTEHNDQTLPEPAAPASSYSTPAIIRIPFTPATGAREKTVSAIRWLTITDSHGSGLRILADSALIDASFCSAGDSISHGRNILLNIASPPIPVLTERANRHYTYKVMPVLALTSPAPIASPAQKPAAREPSPRIHQQKR